MLEVMLTVLICIGGSVLFFSLLGMALVVSGDLQSLLAPILIPLLDLFRDLLDIP